MSAPLQASFGLEELRAAIAAGRLFLTVSEFADLTRLDPRTARRAIEDGQVRAVKFGTVVRIPTVELLRMAELDGTTPENAASAGAEIPALQLLKPADPTSNGPSHDNQRAG